MEATQTLAWGLQGAGSPGQVTFTEWLAPGLSWDSPVRPTAVHTHPVRG